MLQRIESYFNDLLLKNKINCIVVFVNLVLFTAVSVIGLTSLSMQMDKLLNDATQKTLRQAEKQLVSSLEQAEQLSRIIATQQEFQNYLNDWNNNSNSAYNQLILLFGEYRERLSDCYVSYASILGEKTHLNLSASQKIDFPEKIIDEMIKTTYEHDGYPVWIDNNIEENGFYLTRAVKRAFPLTLDNMGVLSFCIDIKKLMQEEIDFSQNYGASYHLLKKDNKVLFSSENLPKEITEKLDEKSAEEYQIININKEKFFVVSSVLEHYNWDYHIIIPYSNVYTTLNNAFLMFFFVLLLGLLISAILCNRLISQITNHLHLLIGQMNNFDASKKVKAPKKSYLLRKDEVGQLQRQFYSMTQQISNYIDKEYKLEILMKEAQLRALEAQIDPHFLYNVLASVTWRAKIIGDKQIPLMLEALSRLLRSNLTQNDQNFTLSQEMALVKDYMTIQQIRFEDELDFYCEIPNEFLNIEIPKLTIQPLLENAILYGMEYSTEPCVISLSAENIDNNLIISVSNTGSTFPETFAEKFSENKHSTRGFGIGLKNIQKRLELAFGKGQNITFSNENGLAVVRLKIPFKL